MPAISHPLGNHVLLTRDFQKTVGQSGMTPTAFAFLIPVFVVAVATPFLCVFFIRKRRDPQPVVPVKRKKPALRREEARQRLAEVTKVADVIHPHRIGGDETGEASGRVESASFVERECAICLSTLHAPAPPEPAKLSDIPITDEAARPPSIKPEDLTEPDSILKLQVCGHEFHAECLVSWFVLRKTSCPICRAVYITKEAMELLDEEAQLSAEPVPEAAPAPVVSNWLYFIHGQNVSTRQNAASRPVQMTAQPPRTRWSRSGTREY